MSELLKLLPQLGFPGLVLVVLYYLDWWPYWYLWLPLPVLAFWLTLQLGVEPSWFPGYADLRQQVMGRSPENNPIAATIGDTYTARLGYWAALRQGHDARSARVLAWLGRWYHPEPFHPQAINRALLIAMVYTLLFWVLPWLLGGSGRLGEVDLLGADLPIYQRWLLLLIPIPLLVSEWVLHKSVLQGWKNLLVFALALAGTGAFAYALKTTYALKVAYMVAVVVAVVVAYVLKVVIARTLAYIEKRALEDAAAGTFMLSLLRANLRVRRLLDSVAVVIVGTAGVGLAVAIAATGTFAGAVAVAVTLAVGAIEIFTHFKRRAGRAAGWIQACALHLFCLPWLLLLIFLPLLLPNAADWPPEMVDWLQFKAGWQHISKPSFALVFFLAILPWLNALSDFFSVGITQKLLQQYRPGRGAFWVIALDVLAAFVLTLLLYLAAIAALQLMAWCGWQGIDTQALRRDFVGGIGWNVNSPAFWLVLLALTNIVPTLLHLGWALWALFSHWLSPEPAHLQSWLKQMAASPKGEGLATTEAKALARYLLVDWWLNGVLVLSFIPLVLYGFMILIPWTVGRLF